MKKALLLPVAALILALVFAIPMVAGANGGDVTAELYAGQDMDAGDVNVSYDSVTGNLTVEFKVVTENWTLAETHVHVATSLEGIPQTKKGNPIPGKFDYSREYVPADRIASDTYVIEVGPVSEGETIFVAAHAELVELNGEDEIIQDETAWVDGEDFAGANWATYILFQYEAE